LVYRDWKSSCWEFSFEGKSKHFRRPIESPLPKHETFVWINSISNRNCIRIYIQKKKNNKNYY
jgi:hypothetical protein